MLKHASKIRVLSNKKVNFIRGPTCSQSSGGFWQKGPPKGLIFGAGAFATFGGVIGYASWSTDNQKTVQNSIPGSKYLLEPILGVVPETPPQSTKPIVSSKPKVADDGLLKKKLEREKAKKEKEELELKEESKSKPLRDKSSAPSTTPPLPPPPPPIAPPPEELEQDLKKIESEPEKDVISNNVILSQDIEKEISSVQDSVHSALKAAEGAAETIRKHTEKAYSSLDAEEGDKLLSSLSTDVSIIKNELLKDVEEKLNVAKTAMDDLEKKCASAVESDSMKDNPILNAAKDKLSEFNFLINQTNSIVAEALRDSSSLSDFKEILLESRKEFESELQSITPGLQMGEEGENLSSEDLKSQLGHAHQKILALQALLAKQQTLDRSRLKEAVLKQREQEARFSEKRLQTELERQRHEISMEYRRRLQQLKEDNENEMHIQLKRQAAAHSGHLSDALHLKEQELEHRWKNKLEEDIQRERDEYLKSLSKLSGQIGGLKSAMEKRADVDKAALEAQKLWMACQSLKSSLRIVKEETKSWEEQLLPLQERVDAIRMAAGEGNDFAEAVLSSIPSVARQRGVYTEDALRERFIKVSRVCKRVSMVGDNGAPLYKYLLSYVQSFLILNAFDYLPGREVRDEEVPLQDLNTHDLLSRAKYCLEKDDLLQGIRYMNLLRGEPKHVAKDWIAEARLSLEAKLAADALMAHAAATGAKAL